MIIIKRALHLLKTRSFFYSSYGFIYLFMMALLCCHTGDVLAQGNLLVTPRRVVFEGTKRSQELNLANTGKDTARYLISVIEIRMKPDGTFEEITKPDSGQYFASDYLRIFPRSVTLAPNEAQLVKMQLKNSSQLAQGEYRSHIYFRAVPQDKPLGEPDMPKDTSSISIKLVPVFGITMPVIIRVGESTSEVKLSNVSFETTDNIPKLNLTFYRTGNMSVYGDMRIDFITADNQITQVAMVKGIAVYTPNLSRQFQIELEKKPGLTYGRGKFHVVYTMQSGGKAAGSVEAYCDILKQAQ